MKIRINEGYLIMGKADSEDFKIIRNVTIATLLIVAFVSGTVSLILMSDKSIGNDDEKAQLAEIAQDSEQYADKMLAKSKADKNAAGKNSYVAVSDNSDSKQMQLPADIIETPKDRDLEGRMHVNAKKAKGNNRAAKDETGNIRASRASGGTHVQNINVLSGNSTRIDGVFNNVQGQASGNGSSPAEMSNRQENNNLSSDGYGADSLGKLQSGASGSLTAASRAGKFRNAAAKGTPGAAAENAIQQAKAVNSMVKEASHEESSSSSRSMADDAWTGSVSGSENLAAASIGADSSVVDMRETSETGSSRSSVIYYGRDSSAGKDKKSEEDVPEVSKSENVTPWVNELKALRYIFMIAMAMLAIAAALADTQYGKQIAIGMSAAAMAMSATAVALAITIMAKYKQYALGGMWLAIAGVGLAASAVACISGIAAYRQAQWTMFSFIGNHMKIFLALCGVGGGLLTGILGAEALENTNQDDAKQYCKDNPDHAGCKKTSALPYEIIKEAISDNSDFC